MNGYMLGVKKWYQSLGVWGSLGTIVAGLLSVLHIAHSDVLEGDLNAWSAAAGVVITGLISLWGRIRATRQIGTPTTPGVKSLAWLLVASCWLLVAGSGCSYFQQPGSAYVKADRLTHDAIAPEYAAYVHADPALSADQKARRDNTLETWELRIESAEKAATQPTTQP